MFEPRDVEAASIVAFVLSLIPEDMPAIPAPNDVEAVSIALFVFELTLAVPAAICEPIELEAVVMSDCSAREPEVKVPSVRLRVAYVQTSEAVNVLPDVRVLVPFVHTSAANVPNVVKERLVLAQTAVGIVARSDVEAVNTVAFVFAFIVDIAVEI